MFKGDNYIRITARVWLTKGPECSGFKFIFELIILFSYLFLASLFSLLTSTSSLKFIKTTITCSLALFIHDMFLGLIVDPVRHHSDYQTMSDIRH